MASTCPARSTSFAPTKLLASDDGTQSTTAVICNPFAVDTYGGLVRNRGIQNPNNFTIFLTLSPKRPVPADRVLVTVACPDSDGYEASVDPFARGGCPMMFSSLVGEFSPEAPTFVEVLVPPHVDAEKLIRFEGDASNGVRRFVGSFAADELISRFKFLLIRSRRLNCERHIFQKLGESAAFRMEAGKMGAVWVASLAILGISAIGAHP